MTLRKMALVFFALCLAVMTVGCGEPDLLAEYTDAVAKINELTSLESKVDMIMDIKGEGFETSMPISMYLKAKMKDGAISEMENKTTTQVLGNPMDISMYYTNGMGYYDAAGIKYKQELDSTEVSDLATETIELTSDMLKNATRTKKDGVISVSMSFDGNKFKDAVLGYLPDDTMETLGPLDSFTLSDVDMSYTIDNNGYLSSIKMKFTISLSEADSSGPSELTMDVSVVYLNPGKDVTIQVPNLDEYQELSGNLGDEF